MHQGEVACMIMYLVMGLNVPYYRSSIIPPDMKLFYDAVCFLSYPERDAAVCWSASQPKVQRCSSLSSKDPGPAAHTSFMDQASQPGSGGEGGSAGCLQRLDGPVL